VKDKRVKYTKGMLPKVEAYFEAWEPFIDIITKETVDKDGKTTTESKRVPNALPTLGDIAKKLGITRVTLWRWEETHEDLCSVIKKGTKKCFEEWIFAAGMTGQCNHAIVIFTAKNKLNWKDKSEVELPGGAEYLDLIARFRNAKAG